MAFDEEQVCPEHRKLAGISLFRSATASRLHPALMGRRCR
jgi:hypothetical protein